MSATRRIRKYQRGTDNVPVPPDYGPPSWAAKQAAGLYDPGGTPLDKEYAKAYQEHEALMAELRKTAYKTIGVNINGQEMEIPVWYKGMTNDQAENAARDRLEMGLHPFAPEDQLIKAQNDEQMLPNQPIGFAKGTDSVPAMLTPHEAVLNRNAADMLGRDKIRMLNMMGNRMPQHFGSGTDDVKLYRALYGPTLPPPFANEIAGFGVRQFSGNDRLQNFPVRPYYVMPGIGVQPQPSTSYGAPLERQYASGTDDVKDLLRETEDTFYGGGHAVPQPTPKPKPTPAPRLYAYGTADVYGATSSNGYSVTPPQDNPAYQAALRRRSNAAGRVLGGGGILNVTPSNPISGSRYIGRAGVDLGAQYDPTGGVNPLPIGAVGVQGVQNATQPQFTAPAPMTHTQMAEEIAKRNLTAAGSLLGSPQQTSQTPSLYPQPPTSYPRTPEGNINFNVPGGSVADYMNRFGSSANYTGADASVGALDSAQYSTNDQGQQVVSTPSGGQIISGVGTDELTKAGIRPGRYADAAGPISRSGTGYSYITASGSKVDIAGSPPDQQRRRDQGYGSAYGY